MIHAPSRTTDGQQAGNNSLTGARRCCTPADKWLDDNDTIGNSQVIKMTAEGMSVDGDDTGSYDLRAALLANDESIENKAQAAIRLRATIAQEYPRLAIELLILIRAELQNQPNVSITSGDLHQSLLGGGLKIPVKEWTIQYRERKIKFQAAEDANPFRAKFNIGIDGTTRTCNNQRIVMTESKENKDIWKLGIHTLGETGVKELTPNRLRRFLGTLMLDVEKEIPF